MWILETDSWDKERVHHTINGLYRECKEVEQTLGKALEYPWYCDDQQNFPGATREDGVCTGIHVAASIAAEAAKVIIKLKTRIKELEGNQ